MLGFNRTLVNPGTPSDEVARQAAESAQRRNLTNLLIREGWAPEEATARAKRQFPTSA